MDEKGQPQRYTGLRQGPRVPCSVLGRDLPYGSVVSRVSAGISECTPGTSVRSLGLLGRDPTLSLNLMGLLGTSTPLFPRCVYHRGRSLGKKKKKSRCSLLFCCNLLCNKLPDDTYVYIKKLDY